MNRIKTQIELIPRKEDRRRFTLLTVLLFLSVKLMLVSWSQENYDEPELEFYGVWQNPDSLIEEITIGINNRCSILNYQYDYRLLNNHSLEIYGAQGFPLYKISKLDEDTLIVFHQLIPNQRKIYKRQHDTSPF